MNFDDIKMWDKLYHIEDNKIFIIVDIDYSLHDYMYLGKHKTLYIINESNDKEKYLLYSNYGNYGNDEYSNYLTFKEYNIKLRKLKLKKLKIL